MAAARWLVLVRNPVFLTGIKALYGREYSVTLDLFSVEAVRPALTDKTCPHKPYAVIHDMARAQPNTASWLSQQPGHCGGRARMRR